MVLKINNKCKVSKWSYSFLYSISYKKITKKYDIVINNISLSRIVWKLKFIIIEKLLLTIYYIIIYKMEFYSFKKEKEL